MASVERRVRDGKVTWQAPYRDPAGRQRKRSFPRKSDAEHFMATVRADVLRGAYVDQTDRTTVAEYARTWVAARPHKPQTARATAYQIEKHIARTPLGSRRLGAVLPSEVQAWVTDRSRVLAPSSLGPLVSLLRSIFASAALDRLVASSPAVRLTVPRNVSDRIVPLTVEQVRALADAMPERNQAMVLTQAGLGLRIGELLALRVCDVDFLRRTVRIETQFAGRSKVRTAPKTPRSKRTLPLPSIVGDALAAHLATFPAGQDGSVFTTSTGRPFTGDSYGTTIFRRAVRSAGVPEGTTSHALRHHYASLLLAAGEGPIAVAARLGHDNANLVFSTYGHLMPDTEDRTRAAVDDAWCAPCVPQDHLERL